MDVLLWGLVPVVGFAAVWLVKWVTSAVADQLIDEVGDRLQVRWESSVSRQLRPVKTDLQTVKDQVKEIRGEVTLNGGGSMKDMVQETHRQLEHLLTDGR